MTLSLAPDEQAPSLRKPPDSIAAPEPWILLRRLAESLGQLSKYSLYGPLEALPGAEVRDGAVMVEPFEKLPSVDSEVALESSKTPAASARRGIESLSQRLLRISHLFGGAGRGEGERISPSGSTRNPPYCPLVDEQPCLSHSDGYHR